MMDQTHVTDLLPAYALGALDPDERQMVKNHLASCDVCRVELQSFYETAGILATLSPQVNPPKQLKLAIMSQVQPTASKKVEKQVHGKPAWLNWFKQTAPVWGIASFILLAGLIISNYFWWQSINQANQKEQKAQQQLAAMVRAANNFKVVPMASTTMAPMTGAVLVITNKGASGTLVVNGLPQLDSKHQYQLWLVKNGMRASGGVFSMQTDGYSLLEINSAPSSLLSYTSFGVTIEPFGGSPGPTGKKVLGGSS